MAGIYLHIPFCKQACHYCDFHFSTSLKYKEDMLQAMNTELELQKNYLNHETIETIYFGGGTPSVLNADDIKKITGQISKFYNIAEQPEITLEANPDDLSTAKVKELRNTGINRLSIGIQSFFDEDLRWMNRAHTASEAEGSVKRLQDAGFENITVDLIYGYSLLSDEKWKTNIRQVVDLQVPHVSAYSMTVEPQTALASFIRKGKQPAMNEVQSARQFQILSDLLQQAGFEHYEISNFALPGRYSRHNSNYWKARPYLGIGPSAHSYNGKTRQWNVANNAKYISALFENTIPAELETLTAKDRLNEYIMTSIRTMWGMNLDKIEQDFGSDYRHAIEKELPVFSEQNWILRSGQVITLTSEGKLFADRIAAELFVD